MKVERDWITVAGRIGRMSDVGWLWLPVCRISVWVVWQGGLRGEVGRVIESRDGV